MKKVICRSLFILGICAMLGIIGGIDNGSPITNLLWLIPIILVMWVLTKVGEV
jgi:hypothetical protein